MSAFVHGPLFWGGIGLLSIPIILHIINRRRFRRLDWAAMEFLLEALRRNRRRFKRYLDESSANERGNIRKAILQDAEAAVASYRRALSLNPDHGHALNNLGSTLESE